MAPHQRLSIAPGGIEHVESKSSSVTTTAGITANLSARAPLTRRGRDAQALQRQTEWQTKKAAVAADIQQEQNLPRPRQIEAQG
jgi:hypothetical protein